MKSFDPTKLKIGFLAGTLGRGGAERQLLYMLRGLHEAGVNTRVLCFTKGESFENEIRALGIDVEYLSAPNGSRPGKLYRLLRSLRRRPVDILQSVHFYTNLYGAAAGRLTGVREIGAIRSDFNFEMESRGLIGRLQLNSPRHLITNSALARQRAIAAGVRPEKIDLVSNVVDTTQSNGKRTFPPGEEEARVLFVGRLTEEKRADRFLRVMSRVVREAKPFTVKAAIAGDGPLRPRLMALAGTLGLGADTLEMLGEREDMTSVYRQSDLLMLTSDLEGTPNVLLEAMSHGLPVMATRVGGVPDIVGEDRGMLCDPEDEDGLTGAAMKLVTNPGLRQELGRCGQDYVARFHSIHTLPDRLMEIYRKLLSQ